MKNSQDRFVGMTESEDYFCIEDLQSVQDSSSFNPVNLDYYGSEKCRPGHMFGPHVRSCYVLHMVVAGKGELRKEENVFTITEGQAFLIFPGEETVYQADQEDPWTYMWIGFHGFRAEEMMARAGFSREKPVITCRNMDDIQELMNRILSARELTYVNELKRMSGMYMLLALLAENSSGLESPLYETKGRDSDYVQSAIRLLTDSYQSKIRVSDVAKEIGISRSYLTSIFKREMKISPQEFLMNFRMEKAAALLMQTKSPINIIASEVGYSDSLSFSKAFRTRFGVSPSEYRENRPVLVRKNSKGEYESTHPL